MPELSREIVIELKNSFQHIEIDAVAAIESRGFLYGMMLASALNVPFIPVRKAGKLPYKTISHEYALEYGTSKVEIHEDALTQGQKVLIHDDLLATGGTAAAAAELVLRLGGSVAGFSFIVSLDFLKGSDILKKYSSTIHQLVCYE